MTEEEAKTKWCPFARTAPIGEEGGTMSAAVSINRWAVDGDDKPNPFGHSNHCIGPACMAWRWAQINVGPATALDGTYHPASYVASTTDGHCGLAGKP